ncbi:hypothetical protein [Cyclobacterium roseum]|uniref:hypothetical protein n=1 Tax=Cyclobacterium roseum TaxID=2666137 RepID=UPI00139120EE|nr:hypothetical protein [Cyclobacterium roseum]
MNKQDISSCLEFYTTAIFYDEKARAIQSLSQHQLGGTVRNSTDNANRLTTANYTASGETNWFTVNGMLIDGNGNLTKLVRRNQMTASTYGGVDNLTYTYQTNSNRLSQVLNSHLSATFTSKDFKERSGTAYTYDANGSLSGNLDKQINTISYNHLNLPDTVTFAGTTGKIVFGYDAAGNKLTQKLYTNTTLTKTHAYIGETVYVDGSLDYLMHEEGRVAYELCTYQYEYHVKDHLGNVRQVPT